MAVRADSLSSIIILLLWESSLLGTSNTKVKARINGIRFRSQMQKFRFLFGIFLSEMILQHSDRLSSTAGSELSSVEGHEVAILTAQTLQGMSTERDFDLFWAKIETTRKQFEVEEPILLRIRKIPKRLHDCMPTAEFPDSVIDWYRLLNS